MMVTLAADPAGTIEPSIALSFRDWQASREIVSSNGIIHWTLGMTASRKLSALELYV
jgi:hypothetical protein